MVDYARAGKWLGVLVTAAVALAGRFVVNDILVATVAGFPGGFVAGIGLRRYQEPLKTGAYVGLYGSIPYVLVALATTTQGPVVFFLTFGLMSMLVFLFPLTGAVGAYVGKGLTPTRTRSSADHAD